MASWDITLPLSESAVQNPPKFPKMTTSPLRADEPQETAEKIPVPGPGWIRKGIEQREDAEAHGIKEFKDFKKVERSFSKTLAKVTMSAGAFR